MVRPGPFWTWNQRSTRSPASRAGLPLAVSDRRVQPPWWPPPPARRACRGPACAKAAFSPESRRSGAAAWGSRGGAPACGIMSSPRSEILGVFESPTRAQQNNGLNRIPLVSDSLGSVRAGGKDHAQTANARSHGDDALEGLLRLIRATGTEAQGSGLRLAQGRSQRSQAALVHPSSASAPGC